MKLLTGFPISFGIDACGVVFAIITGIIFLSAGIYGIEYGRHDKRKISFWIPFVLSATVELCLCMAQNILTFYMCFEMLTLMSAALVWHERSREAIMASLKYLFFSLFGAYMALFGIFFFGGDARTLSFAPGGNVDAAYLSERGPMVLICTMLMILGFGVKAGSLPLHAWLPTAHPVAPTPASAVMSAVIVKAGVLGIVRTLYYVVGPGVIQGTWVQTAGIIIAVATIFAGSMLAYGEPVLKKRLAYSTVSQLSYITLGLYMMNPVSITGSLLHVYAHACIKAVLFMSAGAIIHYTGRKTIDECYGIGKAMPITIGCYTIASLGLVGIPPTGGFVSKWYLALGALGSNHPILGVVAAVVLLISALLTAGYLFPLSIRGFLPGDRCIETPPIKESPLMTVPLIVLTLASLIMGLCPGIFTDIFGRIATGLF